VREAGVHGGGSSTLPQKQNPVAAISAVACALRAPALVATLLSSMMQEHERAAGAWQAEWRSLTDLLLAVGAAASWVRDCLEHLEVDPRRMRENLDRTGGLVMAERVTAALTPPLGRLAAQDLVRSACAEAIATGRSLGDVLRGRAAVREHVDDAEIAAMLDPAGYLGSTQTFIDRALAVHEALVARAPRTR
jgi:3-carboxy-cis,cis-muconate cycloisomerase